MALLLTIFLKSLLALSSANIIQLQASAEDAEQQLEELKNAVNLQISNAANDLDRMLRNFKGELGYFHSRIGTIITDYNYFAVWKELHLMVIFAEASGYDVTPCTDIYTEMWFKDIAMDYLSKAEVCIRAVEPEAEKTVKDTKYTIDVLMTQVHVLENDIKRCGGDTACISPLVTEILDKKEKIPKEITITVQATKGFLDLIFQSTDSCNDDTVAAYIKAARAGLKEAQECLDGLSY